MLLTRSAVNIRSLTSLRRPTAVTVIFRSAGNLCKTEHWLLVALQTQLRVNLTVASLSDFVAAVVTRV